jgi:prepilin-type N-terminal cleavage/methylation domain-containing protein
MPRQPQIRLALSPRRMNRPRRVRRNIQRFIAFTMIEVMIVVNIIGIIFAIAAPSLRKARDRARTKSCISNLRKIQGAKEQWAMDTRSAGTATPTDAALFGATAYIRRKPSCPSNSASAYNLGNLNTNPTCTYDPVNHVLP